MKIKLMKMNLFFNKMITFRVVIVIFLLSALCEKIVSQNINNTAFTVVIDAGHGGHDSGCLGSHSIEKDVALDLALLLGQIISTQSPYQVQYTRQKDVFIPLDQRIKLANDIAADLFVSIHCNSVSIKGRAHGAETYVMGLHSSEENLEVAKRENASILLEEDYQNKYDGFDPYSIEGHILLSALQNAHLLQSIEAAQYVQDQLSVMTTLRDRAVKQAGFVLLRKATMPSILVEAAFLSDPENEKLITSNAGKVKIAHALAKGIINYAQENEKSRPANEVANVPTTSAIESSIPLTDNIPTVDAKKRSTTYSVQVAALRQPLHITDGSIFASLPDLKERQENDQYKYTVGQYDTLSEAVEAQNMLRTHGLKGAFVVAYEGNKRMQLQ